MRETVQTPRRTEEVIPGHLLAGIARKLKAMETFSGANLVRLVLISVFLTSVDTIQSYYNQRVINVFSEANAIPRWFYNFGSVGYALYAPIEFLAMFGMLLTLWAWASYILWYHKNVISNPKMNREISHYQPQPQ